MQIVDSFPHRICEIESCPIPMSDGVRLSARIWMPEGAERSPVPAIVEYLPYRKRDRTRVRDEPMHRWFAGHGYAAVRIDLRGCGESEGVLLDEYLELEQKDGVECIAWIASQPWCSGAVGMIGKSWGGFNALQIAARRPPALRAIITVCSTDDRYADDAHYMGGCLLNENLIYGSILQTINAHPPDPIISGERWREMWLSRMREAPLYPATWLRHQRRDAYWKQGSICEDYGAIECAVYAVGGWEDAYTNAVPRLLAGLTCPRKGLIGPWAHVYPHQSARVPIGFLQESLRWWDRWLKGKDDGIMEEPILRAWMDEGGGAGRWVAEEAWPSPRIERRIFAIDREIEHSSPQTTGLAAGRWCPFGAEGELATDQREDDAKSLLLDFDVDGIELLGAPAVTLDLAIDRPIGFVAVRLLDVAPDGASTRVSYGLLNLTQRESREAPEPMEPGRRCRVRVQLNDTAHEFAPGHRARVAISTAYWPIAWPSPEPVTLSLYGASIELPVRPPRPDDAQLPAFEPPQSAPAPRAIDLHPDRLQRTVERDPSTGVTTVTTIADTADDGSPAMLRLAIIGLEYGHSTVERFRIRDDDPLSAEAEITNELRVRRDDWIVHARLWTRMTCTKDQLRLEAKLEASERGEPVLLRTWDERIPRPSI